MCVPCSGLRGEYKDSPCTIIEVGPQDQTVEGKNEFTCQYAMRLQVVLDFFSRATPALLANQYCNLALLSFARHGGRKRSGTANNELDDPLVGGWRTAYVVTHGRQQWLYYWHDPEKQADPGAPYLRTICSPNPASVAETPDNPDHPSAANAESGILSARTPCLVKGSSVCRLSRTQSQTHGSAAPDRRRVRKQHLQD